MVRFPAAISNWIYVGVSILAGLTMFFWSPLVTRLQNVVLWFDAVGLSFFAVVGTEKALLHGLDPAMAALLGMLTGIGGGMLRDVLANEIPVVLRADFYALAALAGAAVVAGGHVLHVHPAIATFLGAMLCFGLRFMAIQFGWHLPAARVSHDASATTRAPDSEETDSGS